MRTVFSPTLLLFIFLGCTAGNDDADSSSRISIDTNGSSGEPNPQGTPSDDVATEVVFEIEGVPYDMAETPSGVLYVSIAEHGIVQWDPADNWPEMLTERAGAIFGLEWHDGNIYYTTSVHRQEGALLRVRRPTAGERRPRGASHMCPSGKSIRNPPTEGRFRFPL